MGNESLEHFEKVKEYITSAEIPFKIEPKLVRGLDYYTHTTFEIISPSVGAQNALCGGGRYNLLIEQLGGGETPAVGFAAGIERILLACEAEKSFEPLDPALDVYIVKLDPELNSKVFEIASALRIDNIKVDFDYLDRSVKAQMREANKLNSRFVLFVGGEEYSNGQIQIKNMETGEQKIYDADQLDKIKTLI